MARPLLTTGDELACPGILIFHLIFSLLLLQASGRFRSDDTPRPSGPRHCGQPQGLLAGGPIELPFGSAPNPPREAVRPPPKRSWGLGGGPTGPACRFVKRNRPIVNDSLAMRFSLSGCLFNKSSLPNLASGKQNQSPRLIDTFTYPYICEHLRLGTPYGEASRIVRRSFYEGGRINHVESIIQFSKRFNQPKCPHYSGVCTTYILLKSSL
jgi:hypothetical protein